MTDNARRHTPFKTLTLAPHLHLPLDAVTQTFAIFGKRGSGKTNGATVLVEELLKAGQPVVVLDPVDAWWGLKASLDGKRSGFPIYVFGGAHGDLPLEPGAGALIADVVATQRIPLVLSMKQWSGGERARFVTDFAKRLLQVNTQPVMVVCEEADAFIPQRPMKGEEAMLGAMDRLVRWGRQSGVGCTIVTQRSAKVNKDVTTQAETLIAFRTTGPQDRDAIDNWIKYHAGDEKREEVLSTLPSLPTGTAWVWSPEWLEILKRINFRRRETFDSAATPKPGEQARAPKQLASVDLERLREQMAETVEKAKADDPRELRKQIQDLRRKLTTPPAVEKGRGFERVEVPVVLEKDLHRAEALYVRAEKMVLAFAESDRKRIDLISQHLLGLVTGVRDTRDRIKSAVEGVQAVRQTQSLRQPSAQQPPSRRNPSLAVGTQADIRLNRLAERKILQVLVCYGPRTTRALAILAGYAHAGGGFCGAVSKLRTLGLITVQGGKASVTEDGRAAIGDVAPLPSGAELLQHWMGQFNRKAEREVLRVVAAAYPDALPLAEIAERTEPPYEPKGGGFLGAVSKLRTLGLVEGRGELRAAPELCE